MRLEYIVVGIIILVLVILVATGIIADVIPGFEDFLNQTASSTGG